MIGRSLYSVMMDLDNQRKYIKEIKEERAFDDRKRKIGLIFNVYPQVMRQFLGRDSIPILELRAFSPDGIEEAISCLVGEKILTEKGEIYSTTSFAREVLNGWEGLGK